MASRYSVPPRSKPQMREPMPMEKTRTLIRNSLAARKCPSSWMKMITPTTTRKARMLLRKFIVGEAAVALLRGC